MAESFEEVVKDVAEFLIRKAIEDVGDESEQDVMSYIEESCMELDSAVYEAASRIWEEHVHADDPEK